jgi:hypothetical protein
MSLRLAFFLEVDKETHWCATRGQDRVNPQASIHLAVILKNRLDLGGDPGIFSLVLARRTLDPRIIATFRNLQRSVHHPNRMFLHLFYCKMYFLLFYHRYTFPDSNLCIRWSHFLHDLDPFWGRLLLPEYQTTTLGALFWDVSIAPTV